MIAHVLQPALATLSFNTLVNESIVADVGAFVTASKAVEGRAPRLSVPVAGVDTVFVVNVGLGVGRIGEVEEVFESARELAGVCEAVIFDEEVGVVVAVFDNEIVVDDEIVDDAVSANTTIGGMAGVTELEAEGNSTETGSADNAFNRDGAES